MIYTSYYNNRNMQASDLKKFSVSYTQFTDYPLASELLLDKKDFFSHRNKKISLSTLKTLYRVKVLSKLDVNEIAKKYDNCILLCHEVTGCHREELMQWFLDNGIECEEYPRC